MTKKNRKQQYQLVHNSYTDATMLIQGFTPYGATHAYFANFTTNASRDKMIICIQCYSNKIKPSNAPYMMYNSPTYIKFIISTNHLYA